MAEDDLSLLCFASKHAGGELDLTEKRLAQREYRDCFNALIERGTYVSTDAMSAPESAPWTTPSRPLHAIAAEPGAVANRP